MAAGKKLSKKERKALKKKEKEEKAQRKARQEKMKKYISWGIGIATLAGAVWFFKVAFTPPPPGTVPEVESVNTTDHVKGATESATLLIEYGDFQCPACGNYYPIVEQVVEEKGDQFSFVYRHFPLAQHANADDAAYAAEAAGKQGMFWEMYALLFERQERWSNLDNPEEEFTAYAQELGLDLEQFVEDFSSSEVQEKVTSDYNSGVRAGVNSTPTFYLNGQKITPRSYEEFVDLIEQASTNSS